MRRAIDPSAARTLIQTANELVCPHCQGSLSICQRRDRFVFRLDGLVHQICRDKRCLDAGCTGPSTLYRPPVDLRLALPRMSFGLDVVMAVGQGHLGQGRSLSELGRELSNRGVPIHQTHVGRLFRAFLALTKMARGDDQHVQERLRAQGGMVLMMDGVQFDDRSPVLYLLWDALSGTPLFARRMEERSADALSPLLVRVKKMAVPVLGVVTDAEKGLVPAVLEVFPQVPYQLCQAHFLKNLARPMESDLQELAASVAQRVDKVRKLQRKLANKGGAGPGSPGSHPGQTDSGTATVNASPVADSAANTAPAPAPAEPISEANLVGQLGDLARLGARISGKAPLDPPELVRHQRLEQVRRAVEQAQKKAQRRPSWMPWRRRCGLTGAQAG